MKILFEGQTYSTEVVDNYGLGSYASPLKDRSQAVFPCVGYVYSSKINDVVFILPKVFLFEGSGVIGAEKSSCEIAFGKYSVEERV